MYIIPKNIDDQGSKAGILFEDFAKLYFSYDPRVCTDYKNVWLFKECPDQVKKNLNLGAIDYGVDLVLEDKEGLYTVVQCKFRFDESTNLSWTKDKIANLFAEGDRADHFLVFTNAAGVDKHSKGKKGDNFSMITSGNLLGLTEEVIKSMAAKKEASSIQKYIPRPYQRKAIDDVINGFNKANRGQLILPCGAGKTLASMWIMQEMKANHTLVLLPSLGLLSQIKDAWHSQQAEWSPYLCVCSEKDIDSSPDSVVVHTYEISGNVTTSADDIRTFLKRHDKTIIYSTYQSLAAIIAATHDWGFEFDLAICDEAHKTAGMNSTMFSLVHNDKNVKIKKRLYMTATPRIVSDRLKKKLEEQESDLLLADMSNPQIYGEEFHRMSFGDAIEKKILVNYQIIAIGVSDREIQNLILERFYQNKGITIEDLANNLALEKVMKKYEATHAITFHSTIKRAREFRDRSKKLSPNLFAETVTGEQSTNQRSVTMNNFKKESSGIMTNARCLTEGIDIPTIDLVYFCDPKNSKVDIVQASGRALRKASHKNKTKGYIVVPIFHKDTENLEEAIEQSYFKNLINVVRALCDQDERLQIEINNLKLNKGKRSDSNILSIDFDEDSLIVFSGIGDRLKESLFDQIITKSANTWDVFFNALSEYRNENPDKWPTTNYTFNDIKIGIWVSRQRNAFSKSSLSEERIQKLNSLNFCWNLQDDNFDEKFEQFKRWLEENNGKYPEPLSKSAKETALAGWVSIQRNSSKRDSLDIDRFEQLETINFIWDKRDHTFNEKADKLINFLEKNGKYPAQRSPFVDESKLALFCQSCRTRKRKGDLRKNWEKRLNNIDFQWDPGKSKWEDQLLSVAEFYEKHKRLPSENRESSIEEKKLKQWISLQKGDIKAGRITKKRIKKLELLGIDFIEIEREKKDKIWLVSFNELKKIKDLENRWPNGKRSPYEACLNVWLSIQRNKFKKNKLSDWKIEKMEEIGEWKSINRETQWIYRLETLKVFIEKNKRWPSSKKVANREDREERTLAFWVTRQRNLYWGRLKDYKQLAQDRIQMLNEIGISWGENQKIKTFQEWSEELEKWLNTHNRAPRKTRKKDEENSLYNWLSTTKTKYNRGKLSDEELMMLKAKGINL